MKIGFNLETETANNNLIINNMSLQHLLPNVVKILRHVTRYKTPARKRTLFGYSTNFFVTLLINIQEGIKNNIYTYLYIYYIYMHIVYILYIYIYIEQLNN